MPQLSSPRSTSIHYIVYIFLIASALKVYLVYMYIFTIKYQTKYNTHNNKDMPVPAVE